MLGLRWRKRVWTCSNADCGVNTWTEQSDLVEPRRVLRTRAARWACERVAAIEGNSGIDRQGVRGGVIDGVGRSGPDRPGPCR